MNPGIIQKHNDFTVRIHDKQKPDPSRYIRHASSRWCICPVSLLITKYAFMFSAHGDSALFAARKLVVLQRLIGTDHPPNRLWNSSPGRSPSNAMPWASKVPKGLRSLESRHAFLKEPIHRIRFLYTPRHCS